MKALGLDLDGVIYPWHEAVLTYYEMYEGYTGSYTEFWGEFYKQITPSKWEYLTGIDYFYSCKIPGADTMEFLRKVAEHFEIYYITSRPAEVALTTEQYLRRFDFPFCSNLIITEDKSRFARLYGLRYFIDDQPKNLEPLSKVTEVAMMSQPYNRDYSNKYRVVKTHNDMLEFFNIQTGEVTGNSTIDIVSSDEAVEFMKGRGPGK